MRVALADYYRGKHALITGGSSGIGLAMAKTLLDFQASVTLIARTQSALDKAQAELQQRSYSAQVEILRLDVSDWPTVNEQLSAHLETHPAQILINSAGVSRPGRFLEQGPEIARTIMDINYFGCLHTCKIVAPHLIGQGGGDIMNIGSLAGAISIYGYTAYASSKFALSGFSEALRAELKPHKVRVSHLLPPDTDTPMLHRERNYIPAETLAIAGTVKTMAASEVAEAALKGIAKGRYEIVPGTESKATLLVSRLSPRLGRKICDYLASKA